MLKKAERDLDAFIDVLQQAGVTVRQPEPYAYERPLATPDWEVASSCYALMPRDVLFVIGDQIIEAPMGWRSRSTERLAYRELCKEYFRGGARWVAAPPPRLSDESFTPGFVAPEEDEPQRFLPTEYEPMFDAADAIKCGRDVFIARSSCCNRFGIEWLRRHLGDEYAVHEIEVHDTHPMHIDATFQPLAPGKLLINPERVVKVPDMFEKAGWDILVCPEPEMPESHPMYNCSRWIMMNVVMLDETRVVVSAGEKRFVRRAQGVGLRADRVPLLGLRDDRRRVPLRQRRHPPPRRPQILLLSRGFSLPGAGGYASLNANPMVNGDGRADTLSGAKGTLGGRR